MGGILRGKWLKIQAYKHDGTFHRLWSFNYVLRDDDDYFVLASNRSAVIEHNGRKWHTKEPSIFIFSKKQWFNVIAMFKDDNTITYYVNIASPSIYDKGYIKFIDYDLDIKLFGDGSTKLLDVGEYRKHANSLGYPDEIRNILSNSVDLVFKMIQNHQFPFDDDVIKTLYKEFENIN